MRRIFDTKGREITPPASPNLTEMEHVCEIGGQFDETLVQLSVYSEVLDRHEVTTLLEIKPTKAWNPGEQHPIGNGKGGSCIVDWGKWLLTTELDRNPAGPKIQDLLQQCTSNLTSWHTLASKFDTSVTIVGYLENWNRQLELEPAVLQLIADRNLRLNVDVYTSIDDDPNDQLRAIAG